MLRKRCRDRKASRGSLREGLREQINTFGCHVAIFTLVDRLADDVACIATYLRR